MAMAVSIGCVGLGLMGRPIALNLIKAGYAVSVYARRPASLAPLIEAGATPYPSPRALAGHCDIVFTNVSADQDVEAIALGEDGLIAAPRPGMVLVDMSTISPLAARHIAARLGERDVEMLDAPVSGGTQGAEQGTLSIMVGGKAETFQRVLPVLRAVGRHIVHVGDHGAGQIAKACNQLVVAQTVAAIGEAFILARAAGVDPAKVREALLGGFAGSRVLEVHGQRLLEQDFEPGFKARLHHKDMGIVLDTARGLGLELPGSERVGDYLAGLMAQGLGELDSSALVKQLEARTGVKITN